MLLTASDNTRCIKLWNLKRTGDDRFDLYMLREFSLGCLHGIGDDGDAGVAIKCALSYDEKKIIVHIKHIGASLVRVIDTASGYFREFDDYYGCLLYYSMYDGICASHLDNRFVILHCERIKLWDLDQDTLSPEWFVHDEEAGAICLNPDCTIVIASNRQEIKLLSATDGAVIRKISFGDATPLKSWFACYTSMPYVSAAGNFLAVASGSIITVFKLPECTMLVEWHNFDESNSCSELKLSACGKWLLTCHSDGLRIWETNTGKLLCCSVDIITAEWLPNHDAIVVATQHGVMQVLHARTRKEIMSWVPHPMNQTDCCATSARLIMNILL
jgi:WD40 repeat protein